jgi:thiol-disulfide isomerase/thioredoxin
MLPYLSMRAYAFGGGDDQGDRIFRRVRIAINLNGRRGEVMSEGKFNLFIVFLFGGLALLYVTSRDKPAVESGPSAVHVFTEDNFAKEVLQAKELVLVDFWAPWCGPCKQIAPAVEALSRERPAVKFGKLNTDEAKGLRDKYDIQ